ncbi:phospholipid/glycerol acyltransferase [Minicystis rosea]|nr:phospholipid/glycerol acyltransferase [Minicystis rosea]
MLGPSYFRIFAGSDSGVRFARVLAERLRATLHDGDHIPRRGPALLVGNHALLGLDSVALTAVLVADGHRPPRFLAEKNLFRFPGVRPALTALGAIPGRPDEAVALLEAGELVCVYPGGVDDSFKLSKDAYTLQWGDRQGFARVALRARAPIVPVAATGVDDLFEVPRRERLFGRTLLGSDRYDLPIPESLVPRRVPLDFFVQPPLLPEGDARDPEAIANLRQATWDALESVLRPYREGRR